MRKIIITTIFTLLILIGLQINVDASPNTKCVTTTCDTVLSMDPNVKEYHFIIPSQCKLLNQDKEYPTIYFCHLFPYDGKNKIYWDKNPYSGCDLSNEPFWVWQKQMPQRTEKCQ